MKRSIVSMFVSVVMFFCVSPWTGTAMAAAFPGAVGFGTSTAGGRGGKIIAVTNLNDSGSGSFREACQASGARIIVFNTGGTIRLSSNIVLRNPNVTIAGQTAPGGGICVRGGALTIATHDVIVRGMRFRVGDDASGPSPDDRDSLQMDNVTGILYNVVIDHCSVSWAIDEDLEIWTAGGHDITISHCIVSEGLYNSLHSKGPHSMGLIVGMGIKNVTLYGNLLAHNNERNPRLEGSNVEVINNVMYDAASRVVDIGDGTGPQYLCIIGNYFKKGPSSGSYNYPISIRSTTPSGSKIYIADNIGSSYTSGNLYDNSSFNVSSRPFASSGVKALSASDTFAWVLANAGANPQHPDPVDARIIAETRNGTGHMIDTVAQGGGWPSLAAGTPPVDSDHDGMPDSWEIAKGLSPNNAGDADTDRDNDGYTNLEEYLNSFYGASSDGTLSPPVLRIVSTN
jgi:pectate lyase